MYFYHKQQPGQFTQLLNNTFSETESSNLCEGMSHCSYMNDFFADKQQFQLHKLKQMRIIRPTTENKVDSNQVHLKHEEWGPEKKIENQEQIEQIDETLKNEIIHDCKGYVKISSKSKEKIIDTVTLNDLSTNPTNDNNNNITSIAQEKASNETEQNKTKMQKPKVINDKTKDILVYFKPRKQQILSHDELINQRNKTLMNTFFPDLQKKKRKNEAKKYEKLHKKLKEKQLSKYSQYQSSQFTNRFRTQFEKWGMNVIEQDHNVSHGTKNTKRNKKPSLKDYLPVTHIIPKSNVNYNSIPDHVSDLEDSVDDSDEDVQKAKPFKPLDERHSYNYINIKFNSNREEHYYEKYLNDDVKQRIHLVIYEAKVVKLSNDPNRDNNTAWIEVKDYRKEGELFTLYYKNKEFNTIMLSLLGQGRFVQMKMLQKWIEMKKMLMKEYTIFTLIEIPSIPV